MTKTITRILAALAIVCFASPSMNAQTGVTLLDTNFEDWKLTDDFTGGIVTDQANGTFNLPGATVKIQGRPTFNNSSAPNAGTSAEFPNYFRFGSDGSATNQYLEITPDNPFLNGGRITVVVSTNSNAADDDIFYVADAGSWDTPLGKFNQIGKTFTTKTIDLPEDYSGTKTIRLYRLGTTVFLHAIKIETNSANSSDQTVLFDETFSKLTTVNTTKNALTDGLTDETGYTVGGGGSSMLCSENGTMDLTGGRFQTRNMDLSGDDVYLYVTYKKKNPAGESTSRFQIDVDKTGTSGMGTLFVVTEVDAPAGFATQELAITGGTADSYIHFRTESSLSVVLDEIKVVRGKEAVAPAITSFVAAGVSATINEEAGTITAELPAGTSLAAIEPEVTMNAGGDHYTPTGAQDFTDPVTYTVFNADESDSKAYTVTLTVASTLSDDATLSDIKFKGTTITGFAAETAEYNFELPYNSAVPAVADVAVTTTHPNAVVGTITSSSETFPVDITIPVTAEDGTTTATYILHFTMKVASVDATLKSLVVNGNTVPLEAGVTDYTVDLPYTTTEVPTVTATPNDSKASVEILNAAGLEEKTVINVTAEDGATKIQYTVSFNVLPSPTKPITTWNFTNYPAGDIAGTFDGLTIVSNNPEGTAAVTIDANSKKIDDFSFTQRLKLGDSGSPAAETPYLPTSHYVSFKTKGDVTITIYGMSSSSSQDNPRTLNITDGEKLINTFVDPDGSSIRKGIIEYTGDAATIYMYSPNRGFNIYAIIAEGYLGDNDAINNVTFNKEVKFVNYYDILGRPVPAATRGLVIVKTTFTDGTSTSNKLFRLEK